MSHRRCEFCQGPMPPKGNVFCSTLCSARSYAGFDRALFEESAAKRTEKRKIASKLAGTCDWCGSPSKNLYCNKACRKKRNHSDEWERRSEQARARQEAKATTPCLECSKPIGRIVYNGGRLFYCESCVQKRNKESRRQSRKRQAQPNLPLSRGLRRVLEAAKKGARTHKDFQLALGCRFPREALLLLIKRGLLVIRKPPQGKHVYVPAEEALELDGALLETARAEDAYREAWDRVLTTRATLDRILTGTPPVHTLPSLSKHAEESLAHRCLQLLESDPEELFCLKSVALVLDHCHREVGRVLCTLCQEGEIERVALGVYRAKRKAQGGKAA